MSYWIFKLAKKDRPALAKLRCSPGLEAAEDGDWIWLKAVAQGKEPPVEILQLPLVQTYKLDDQNRLFLKEALTPIRQGPSVDWRPLTVLIPLEIPASAMPGKVGEGYQIQLVPSEEGHVGDALLTDWNTWKNYADGAPLVRLDQLQFAVAENKKVLVLGQPLPPIPGREYWVQHHNLLPCGFNFKIPLVAKLLMQRLNEYQDAFLLFDVSGSCQKIEVENIVQASRSAVRLTNQHIL